MARGVNHSQPRLARHPELDGARLGTAPRPGAQPLSGETREIPLSQGRAALVDAADFDWLSAFDWLAVYGKGRKGPYACRYVYTAGVRSVIRMHREVLLAPRGLEVDHINRDCCDNRRSNLRIATRSQNSANMQGRLSSTGYRGVRLGWAGKKYRAQIRVRGPLVSLGLFSTAIDAARAYDDAARLHFGPFAVLNFPDLERVA